MSPSAPELTSWVTLSTVLSSAFAIKGVKAGFVVEEYTGKSSL